MCVCCFCVASDGKKKGIEAPTVSANDPGKWINTYCCILYPIVQWNRRFANSDVPFQSVTNDLLHGQFAMQMYALQQVDVTSELVHSWWFALVQSNNKTMYGSACNIGFVRTSFQLS